MTVEERYWWLEVVKVAFGFILAFFLGFLAHAVSVGNVLEATSAGQKEIIGTLKDVLMVWAGYCFARSQKAFGKSDDKEK